MVETFTEQIRRELITVMIENPYSIANAYRQLFVALHLERVADHAYNIASRLYYMFTGERVKYE